MSKELLIAAHEELIAKYLERHPDATEMEAYDATAEESYHRMIKNIADMADAERMRRKDNQ